MDWENNRIIGFASDVAQAAYIGLRRSLVEHPDLFEHRAIAGETFLSEEWTVIKPDPPLRPDGDGQVIFLRTADPFIWGNEIVGITVADSSLVLPEVEVIDGAGNTHKVEQDRALGEHLVGYGLKELSGITYAGVRIRASKPIKLEQVSWTTCWWKNLK